MNDDRDIRYLVDEPLSKRIIALEFIEGTPALPFSCLYGSEFQPNETIVAVGDKYAGNSASFSVDVYQITADAKGESFDIRDARVDYVEQSRHFYVLTDTSVKALLKTGFKHIGALMQMHESQIPFALPESKQRREERQETAKRVDEIMATVAARKARTRKPAP